MGQTETIEGIDLGPWGFRPIPQSQVIGYARDCTDNGDGTFSVSVDLGPRGPGMLSVTGTQRLYANPPQAVLDAIADCPHGVEVTGDYESVAIRPLLIWQAALDALVSGG